MKKPFISIVIPNYNGMKFLNGCLGSLSKQSFKDYEAIVVDDGSSDGSNEYIEKKFPWVRLIKFKKNKGAAHALNQGIAKSRGAYVLLLDNDTSFSRTWLGTLAKAAIAHPKYSIISAKIWDQDKVAFRKANPTFQHTLNFFGYLIWHDYKSKDNVELFATGGGFSMYKKSILVSPVFDTDYVSYGTDIAFCFKLATQGQRVLMVDAITHHHTGGTFKGRQHHTYFHTEKNRLMNFLIFFEGFTLLRLAPLFIFSLILHNLYSLPRIFYNFKAYLWIISNWGVVMAKRRAIQKDRTVNDSAFTPKLSSKIFDETQVSRFLRPIVICLNAFSYAYFILVGIHSIERK